MWRRQAAGAQSLGDRSRCRRRPLLRGVSLMIALVGRLARLGRRLFSAGVLHDQEDLWRYDYDKER